MSGAQTPCEVIAEAIADGRDALEVFQGAHAFGQVDDDMLQTLLDVMDANFKLIELASRRLALGDFIQLPMMTLASIVGEAKAAKVAQRRAAMTIVGGGRP